MHQSFILKNNNKILLLWNKDLTPPKLSKSEDFWIVQKISEDVLDLVQDFEDEGDVVKHRKSSLVPSKIEEELTASLRSKFCQSPPEIKEKTNFKRNATDISSYPITFHLASIGFMSMRPYTDFQEGGISGEL